VLNLIFLPNGGWRTAVATTFVSEMALLVWLCLLVWYWAMREDVADSVSGEPGSVRSRADG
jgi:hypothetical protein